MSRALVTLAERGVLAEAEAKESLRAAYHRLLEEQEPTRKNEAGRDLIRAIFGKDSIACLSQAAGGKSQSPLRSLRLS